MLLHRSYPALQATEKGFVKGESVPLDRVLPTFARTKVGPRREGVLTTPLQKAARRRRRSQTGPCRIGEIKPNHSLCRQSLRLISFATSLYTREAFAARRLPTRPQNSFTTFFTEKQCRPCLRGTQKEKRRPRRGTRSVFSRSVGKGFYVTLSERNR